MSDIYTLSSGFCGGGIRNITDETKTIRNWQIGLYAQSLIYLHKQSQSTKSGHAPNLVCNYVGCARPSSYDAKTDPRDVVVNALLRAVSTKIVVKSLNGSVHALEHSAISPIKVVLYQMLPASYRTVKSSNCL